MIYQSIIKSSIYYHKGDKEILEIHYKKLLTNAK